MSTRVRPPADPVGEALRGPQKRFAEHRGRIRRYDPDVSVFYAHPPVLDDRDWTDLAELAGPGGTVGLRDYRAPLPDGWRKLRTFPLVMYSGADVRTRPDPAALVLGPDDVDDMLALIDVAQPGPFSRRTIELGRYLGFRDADGALIAMAGERMRPPGWGEISAVATAPQARGQGLAERLIRAVGAHIARRGDVPFLHTTADNPARALYERMGFELVEQVDLDIVQVP
ncbi:MAG: GNAT family N-acetyltransferase [Gordonia sp. (in: high G+C Gram-positive bacteria)]|uniref:GNAT family N-acetyltransferase n=1 Tax=Gordonia sp. (in: high G+C Gram-positive bacteria) TaxID=84139 RepID=UPI0039E314A4